MSTHINNDHLERDLSFLPVDNPKPACLSQDEIRHYNEAGFVAPFSAYEGQELEKIRDYFDYLLDAFQNQYGKNAYAINGYHNLCEGLYDIVTHDAIVDRVADLIGPNVIAWGSHFFCKLPGDPKHVPWHQDASYWPFSPSRTITVWQYVIVSTVVGTIPIALFVLAGASLAHADDYRLAGH